DVDEQPIQDLTLNVDNVFQADDCDAFVSNVDEAPTAQTMFMANFSSANPVYDEVGSSYDLDVLFEVHDHDHYQDVVCEHHEVHEMHDDVQPNYVVDSHTGYTSDNNMIPYDQYVKDNAVQVVQSDVSVVPNDAYMMILNDMHEPPAQHVYVTTQTKVVDKSLTAELAAYKEQVELYESGARFQLTEREQKIDEQLRIFITNRNIKEENLKKELHSVKMQLASTINHNKSMVEEVTSLKKDFKQKENQYLKEFLDMKALKEKSRIKEAKVERPLDRSVASACLYTKHSQELLEYVIGTCLKDFNKRDKKQATTPLNRKKQVTFADQCETSNTNTQKHVEQQITQKTNVLVLPSTRVDSCTDASGSKPRNNTKKNRISPIKSVNKKTVEDHSRTNKSHFQKTNRVDYSISSKRTVINLNSDSIYKTYNKCFIPVNHDMCVIKYLTSVNALSSAKNVMRKVKHVWN
nr:integrase, catalytic region, zinc finger, CCHC-type, peptidase aspartic, catalytic [Tanacetum cinerariifolium]